MRVCVLGGTRFIGRAIVDELSATHDVLVVHRGQWEPPDLAEVPHLHADRLHLGEPEPAAALRSFDPEVVLDCAALGAADSDAVLAAFSEDVRLVVLSSMDTYRAYGALHAGTVTDAVPLDETSPVRDERYPYRGSQSGMDDYEKLDVEERWLARGGTVARLPMVTGPHDYQRRQDFVLRRVRHGRSVIPIGIGNALLTHGDVVDIARGVRQIIDADPADVTGEIFNFGELRTPTMRLRAQQILAAAGSDAELVTVEDQHLPADLGITGTIPQHLLVSASKAMTVLGWEPGDPDASLARTVAWHLENPPTSEADDDFSADDEALASVG